MAGAYREVDVTDTPSNHHEFEKKSLEISFADVVPSQSTHSPPLIGNPPWKTRDRYLSLNSPGDHIARLMKRLFKARTSRCVQMRRDNTLAPRHAVQSHAVQTRQGSGAIWAIETSDDESGLFVVNAVLLRSGSF